MNIKVAVEVFLTEEGNYGMKTTSKNPLTTLGLLEIGKTLLMKNFEGSEESKIVIPEGRL